MFVIDKNSQTYFQKTIEGIRKISLVGLTALTFIGCAPKGEANLTLPTISYEKPVVKPEVLQAIKIVLNGKGEIAKPEHFDGKNLAGITNQQNYLITSVPLQDLNLYKKGTKIPVAELEKILEEEQRYKYKVKNIDVSQLQEGKKLNLEKVINEKTFNESQIEKRISDFKKCLDAGLDWKPVTVNHNGVEYKFGNCND